MGNFFLEFPDKGTVFIDPCFGFRLFRPGPVVQRIDAGIVVFAHGKKFGILRPKEIYGVFLVRK